MEVWRKENNTKKPISKSWTGTASQTLMRRNMFNLISIDKRKNKEETSRAKIE